MVAPEKCMTRVSIIFTCKGSFIVDKTEELLDDRKL